MPAHSEKNKAVSGLELLLIVAHTIDAFKASIRAASAAAQPASLLWANLGGANLLDEVEAEVWTALNQGLERGRHLRCVIYFPFRFI